VGTFLIKIDLSKRVVISNERICTHGSIYLVNGYIYNIKNNFINITNVIDIADKKSYVIKNNPSSHCKSIILIKGKIYYVFRHSVHNGNNYECKVHITIIDLVTDEIFLQNYMPQL